MKAHKKSLNKEEKKIELKNEEKDRKGEGGGNTELRVEEINVGGEDIEKVKKKKTEVEIEDVKKVENKSVMNKDGETGDMRMWVLRLRKKKREVRTMRRSRGWSCHHIAGMAMGTNLRLPKPMQR